MQDIKEVVNMAVAEAIHQELPKCMEEKLNANFFIIRAVQNAVVKENALYVKKPYNYPL